MHQPRRRPGIQQGFAGGVILWLAGYLAGCGAVEGRAGSHDAGTSSATDGGSAFMDASVDAAAAMTAQDGGGAPAVNAAEDAGNSDGGGAALAAIGAALSDFTPDGSVVGDANAINPPTIGGDGYVTVDAGSSFLFGYVASATGGSASSITLTYGSSAFCASGSVAPNGAYASWAEAGFNLSQPRSATGGMAETLSLTGSSMILSFENIAGSPLRVALVDSTFTTWCYILTQASGPVTIALSSFNTQCWDNSGQSLQPGTGLQALQLSVPGSDTTSTPFNFCFLGVTIQ
jgi:hypothetical protein